MKTFVLFLVLGLAAEAQKLNPMTVLNGHQKVTCYGEDNISIVLNAQRTTIKYTVEGESAGPLKIDNVSTDRSTYVSYKTEEGRLTFNAKGSYYRTPNDSQSTLVNCEMVRVF